MITVVNKRVYRGEGVYVGRPTPLGNPYTHLRSGSLAEYRVVSRQQAILAYRPWLREQISRPGPVRDELIRLLRIYRETHHLVLVCWCHPLPCHADILRDVLSGAG